MSKDRSIFFNLDNLEIFLFGVISSIGVFLIQSGLTTWLADINISKSTIGFISFFTIPYALRFFWSSFFFNIKVPVLSNKIGNHKAWLFIISIIILFEILFIFFLEISSNRVLYFCIFIFIYSLLGSCQLSIIDCYRINKYSYKKQSISVSSHIMGYKTGSLLAGSLLFVLVDFFCNQYNLCSNSINWKIGYLVLSTIILMINIVIIFFFPNTEISLESNKKFSNVESIKFAVSDVLNVKNGLYILFFFTIYRLPDAFISNMSNVFFLDMNYSLTEIGIYSKMIGFSTNLIGLFLGAYVASVFKTIKSLFFGAILQMGSNIFFVILSCFDKNIALFCFTLIIENICAGIATCCLMSYISQQCKSYSNPSTSYAFIESFYRFSGIFINILAGNCAGIMNWCSFYILSVILGFIPLCMIYKLR